MNSVIKKVSNLRLILGLLVYFSFPNYVLSQSFNHIRYDSFEEYGMGTNALDYWFEQNCGSGPSCGNTCVSEALIVTNEQARSGSNSLRFQRIDDDKVITGGSDCSARNEIGNWNDAFATYGDDVWFGFSIYIADNHLQDRWSQNNVTIFQFKNIDAGGGGNSFGSLKSYRKDGVFTWFMYGYGDIGPVELNQWIDVVIHLKYGTNNNGIVEAWVGDNYIYKQNVSFPAKLACYPKFGSYSDVLGSNSPMHKIYFDEIRFGKAPNGGNYYDEVAPGGNGSTPENPNETNIALNKPVMATGFQDNSDGTFPPQNLVDGNVSDESRWSAEGFPQSVEIDLESTFDISRFDVYTFQNRAYQYTIELKPEGGIYTTVVNRSNNSDGGIITDDIAATGRYVKITVTGASGYTGSWVSLRELMVFGEENTSTVPVTGVAVSITDAQLDLGQTQQLNASVTPSDATDISVSWSSSNTSVATVNANGLVSAVGIGNATITVTTTDGDFTATCEVTVVNAVQTFTFSPIDDAYVRGSTTYSNNENFNTNELIAKNNDPWGGQWTRKSFIKFDLTGLAGNITNAALTLHCKSKDAAATNATLSAVGNNSWSESTITSANMPIIGTQIMSFTPTAGSSIDIDLTDHLSAGELFSFAVVGVVDAGITWYSNEESNSSLRPVLTLEVENAQPVPTNIALNKPTTVSAFQDDALGFKPG